jgi:hypothetical protein
MKQSLAALGALPLVLPLGSCLAGPHQLSRSVDDFDHQLYLENPLLDGVLWVIPVLPFASVVALVGDFLVVDPYHFWFKDLWRSEGTAFDHWLPERPAHRVGSLVNGGPFLFEAR